MEKIMEFIENLNFDWSLIPVAIRSAKLNASEKKDPKSLDVDQLQSLNQPTSFYGCESEIDCSHMGVYMYRPDGEKTQLDKDLY